LFDQGEIKATPTPPWTREVENKLRELIIGAKSVEAIAKLLNRTPLAARRRASTLRLSEQWADLASIFGYFIAAPQFLRGAG
jgi:hypothetical protein